MNRKTLAGLALGLMISNVGAQTLSDSIKSYSNLVYASYKETHSRAVLLQTAIKNFTNNPGVMTQSVAKEAWIHARESYGQTEAFRFYNGPIDRDGGPEGLLNSWPLDEGYIDYVQGAPASGIIGDEVTYPVISRELLTSLNELDGEKNISTGYHAIEFLLWGQDFYKDGPGRRSYEDYLDGSSNFYRRATYLNLVADLLVEDTAALEKEWRVNAENYRAEFESLKDTQALKKILSGIIFMAGDELSGERMYVSIDTQGQEDEQSCFSDMTHMDIQWNFWGIYNVIHATKILELPEVKGNPVAGRIKARLSTLFTVLETIPVPFDQAITNEEGRALILNGVEELEGLAKDLVIVSKLLNAKVDY